MTVWIGLLITACAIAVLVSTLLWRRRVQMAELGTVSTQWLTEHREDRHYSDR